MSMRHDALFVASSIAVFARQLSARMGGRQLATVGSLSVFPSLVNVVPSKAVITVDLRNTEEEELKSAIRRIIAFAQETAAAESTTLEVRTLARFEPVSFSPRIMSRWSTAPPAAHCRPIECRAAPATMRRSSRVCVHPA